MTLRRLFCGITAPTLLELMCPIRRRRRRRHRAPSDNLVIPSLISCAPRDSESRSTTCFCLCILEPKNSYLPWEVTCAARLGSFVLFVQFINFFPGFLHEEVMPNSYWPCCFPLVARPCRLHVSRVPHSYILVCIFQS